MRTSKRDTTLKAALSVVETDGVTALTYESVAAASGLTKGGLLYHFPSKDAMMLALHEHQAQHWDEEMIHALGKDPDEASQDERLAAYARVSARGATGAELLLMLEASTHSELSKPWKRVITRWVPDPASIDPTDPRALQKMVAYLAADGLWLSESVGAIPLPHQLRAALAEHLARSVADADENSRATRRTNERKHPAALWTSACGKSLHRRGLSRSLHLGWSARGDVPQVRDGHNRRRCQHLRRPARRHVPHLPRHSAHHRHHPAVAMAGHCSLDHRRGTATDDHSPGDLATSTRTPQLLTMALPPSHRRQDSRPRTARPRLSSVPPTKAATEHRQNTAIYRRRSHSDMPSRTLSVIVEIVVLDTSAP